MTHVRGRTVVGSPLLASVSSANSRATSGCPVLRDPDHQQVVLRDWLAVEVHLHLGAVGSLEVHEGLEARPELLRARNRCRRDRGKGPLSDGN